MSSIAASFIGSDDWTIQVHGSISFAARLSGAIKDSHVTAQLAYCFWRVNSKLDNLFDHIYDKLDEVKRGEVSTEPADPQRIQDAIAALRNLHHVLDGICRSAKVAGLANNSLVASGVLRLRRNDDRVLELADWITDMISPEELDRLFAKAQEEYERGETVVLND
jgi:hypothetical protein